jgi:predicted esterase
VTYRSTAASAQLREACAREGLELGYRMTRSLLLLLVFLPLLSHAQEAIPAPKGKKTDEGKTWSVYTPPDMGKGKRPVLVCFDPHANWKRMFDAWAPVADQLKWHLLFNKVHRNGVSMSKPQAALETDLKTLKKKYAFDLKRIACTGYSGGGMTSHCMAKMLPKIVRAVIPNTGMIHPSFKSAAEKKRYPKRKIVAFLASPKDFRYKEMKSDRAFLESLKWKVKWIEFKGGHVIAPYASSLQAAQFIEGSWHKKKKKKTKNEEKKTKEE